MKLSDLNPFKKLKKKEVKMSEKNLEQRVQELEQVQGKLGEGQEKLASAFNELKPYWDSKFEELGTRLVEHTNQPDEGEVEQRGFKRGQEEVVSAFENNTLMGELQPIAQRIFNAIRKAGYDIKPHEELAEVNQGEEAPEPPYLHIIDQEKLDQLPDEERNEYSPWTEGRFARIVEAV
jgi:predicted nuclease with TOPRIM domain